MELTFLGTSSAVHSEKRNHSGINLNAHGEHILFDCGEGIQRQYIFAKISPMKITKIFLTHYHGDHILGVPGLLQSMNFRSREKPLDIYGPKGLHKFENIIKKLNGEDLKFKVNYHEMSEGKVFENKKLRINACKVKHNVETLAYSIEEIKKPKFLREKAIELGIPEGPLFGKLQRGESVEVNGRIVKPEEVLGKTKKGIKICYSGDTRLCEEMILFAKDSDVLIHESTYLSQDFDKAQKHAHSTSKDAAIVARDSNSKKLILTHISTRYDNTELKKPNISILKEAKEIFKNAVLAEDLMKIEIK